MFSFKGVKAGKVFRYSITVCLLIFVLVQLTSCDADADNKKMNVLFISVDDLRPEINSYTSSQIISPNIDRLASNGLLFQRAYCQQATCSPSRTSLLTGLRPESVGVLDLVTHFRKNVPDIVTLPELFKNNGYYTQSFGKIFHPNLDDPQSWSGESWWSQYPDKYNYRMPEIDDKMTKLFEKFKEENKDALDGLSETGKMDAFRRKHRGPAWGNPDVDDIKLADGECAEQTIRVLREVKDKPFFLAAGFRKPHLPFVAPKKYYDLYPLDQIKLPQITTLPDGAPAVAGTNWPELRKYSDIPKQGPVSDQKAKELIRAYYACVSFIDAQVGKLLNELDALELTDNTIVILWGDHGWHLLDYGLWSKHTNYEIGTRVPFILSVPGMEEKGKKTLAISELIDVYPTLAELCDLPLPQHLEGKSLMPLISDANQDIKDGAYSLFPRKVEGVGEVMGRTVRTAKFRFVEWINDDGSYRELELYDHSTDPEERVNVAHNSEYKQVIEEHTQLLDKVKN